MNRGTCSLTRVPRLPHSWHSVSHELAFANPNVSVQSHRVCDPAFLRVGLGAIGAVDWSVGEVSLDAMAGAENSLRTTVGGLGDFLNAHTGAATF